MANETNTSNKATAATEQPYSAFTPNQKWLLVIFASTAATFSGFASNIYFPALPVIAEDLHTSVTLINLTVTAYMVFQGLAPSVWGPIADVKGRRVAYICTFIVFIGACIGLALTVNYTMLVVLRCVQSTGSAATIALGSGVIGDITTREDRGGYMGVFQAGLLVPVAVAPVIGGAIADRLGWKAIFWFLTIYAGAFLVIIVLGFPETLRSIVGNGAVKQEKMITRFPLTYYQRFQDPAAKASGDMPSESKHIDLLAPFRVLFDKRVIIIILFLSIYYTVWQMSITIMSTSLKSTYHLSETSIGLCFITNGVGSMIGTFTTGRLLDLEYRRAMDQHEAREQADRPGDRTPFPIEHARLRLLPVFASLQWAAVLVFGWTLDFRTHISVPIIATFFIGWAAVSIQSMTMTYLVDAFPDKSASASAALNIARCLMGAIGTATVAPLVESVNVGPCFSILTALMVSGSAGVAIQTYIIRRKRSKLALSPA